MKGVFDIYNLPVGRKLRKGEAIISTFEFQEKNDPLYNLRMYRDGYDFMAMRDGKYIKLEVDGVMMMSDTPMELRTNMEFTVMANGKVLIGGLGIGLLLHNLKDKLKSGEVSEVLVVERSQDVIDLVGPYFKHPKVKIIQGDIFEWKPEPGQKYDTIYFDIWHTLSTENLPAIKKLHNRFKFKLNRSNPNCYMNSWVKKFLQSEKRKYA